MSGKHERRGPLAWLGKKRAEPVAEALVPPHQIECCLCGEVALVQSDAGELLWLHAHLAKHPGYRMWETGPLSFYQDPCPAEEAAIARARMEVG